MRKTLIATAVATVLAAPTLVLAADPTPTHTFSPNVGVVSDYLFRGVSQTHGKPAIQGGVDYSHASGLYAGVWGSTITWVKDLYGSGRTEIDLYAGFKNSFAGDFTYDVGLIKYNYPGKGAALPGLLADPTTTEVYGAIGYKWITVKYSQAVSSHFIGWMGNNGASTNSRGSNYLEANAAFDLGDGWGVAAHVGRQKVKNVVSTAAIKDANYVDWNVGVTKDVGFGVVGLAYSDTNAKGSCSDPLPAADASAYCWGNSNFTAGVGPGAGFKDAARGTVVLSFKKTF